MVAGTQPSKHANTSYVVQYGTLTYNQTHWQFVVYISYFNVDGWVQDCSNSIASTLELLQSYSKPSMWSYIYLEYAIDTVVINVHY